MANGFVILTVSQLNFYARSVLENDGRLNGLFLRGEISNFTNHYRSGHFYMTLKDENAAVRAVMFRSSAQRLPFLPQDGMKVIVSGRASIYDRDGQFQFYIEDMQPEGVGALHVAFEQLKEKLSREGLFDPERKRKLPAYPARVGVVTSPTGAAIQDICHILQRRWPVAEVVLCPVLVQGDEAPGQICRAIDTMSRVEKPDVLIVGRGGGSMEDLWAFNTEEVARAIAAAAVPVVSAVGHETDFTISDFVADLRAPTPSAAAELVSPDMAAVAQAVAGMRLEMEKAARDRLADGRQRLESTVSTRALRTPLAAVDMHRMALDMLTGRRQAAMHSRLEKARASLGRAAAGLDGMSPLRVLARGYAIPEGADGRVLPDVESLRAAGAFSLRMRDGTAKCRVEKREPASSAMGDRV